VSLFTAASVACGVSPNSGFLIAFRALQGAGGGLMIPGSLALITSSFASQRRGRAIGTWAAGTTIATIAGPLFGGLLADAGFWRGVFFINIPLAATSLAVLVLKVPETLDRRRARQVDVAGVVSAFAGLAGITFGLTVAPEWGFADPRSYLSLVAGALALAVFIFVEKRQRNPLVPLSLFRSGTFSGANLITLLLYGALSAYTLFLNLNLIQAQGYRETLAGLAILPFAILLAAISRWAGRLVERIGPRVPLIVGPALVAVSFLLHSFIGMTAGPTDYWATFFPVISLFGVGMGLTVAPLTTAVMNAVHSDFAGTASGINNGVSRVASVLAVAVIGAVALFSFTDRMQLRAAEIELSRDVRMDVAEEAEKLGDASVPRSVPQDKVDRVAEAFTLSFIGTYQLIMRVCASLAALGVLAAAVFVRRDSAEEHSGGTGG